MKPAGDPTGAPVPVSQYVGAATGVGADSVRAQAVASMPTGRLTTPRGRHARRAAASPRTANVTGSNYVIDGGLIKTM